MERIYTINYNEHTFSILRALKVMYGERTCVCKDCNQEKTIDQYYKRAKGNASICKDCEKIRAARWKKNNPEKYKKNEETYRRNNGDAIKAKNNKYHKAIKEEMTDAHIRRTIYSMNMGIKKKTLDENPEDFAIIKEAILRKNEYLI